jgi:hypothetical protein
MGNGIIEQMQAEIAELKAKVAAMEEWMSNGKTPKTLSEVAEKHCDKLIDVAIKEARKYNAQADRDEIIEKAKRDINGVKKKWSVDDSLQYIFYKGNDSTCGYICDLEFVVNKEKRTVVAILRHMWDGIMSRGIAKCAPDDCFNVHIGKAIALRRALGLEVPAEYLNAPQPTEVRVGDVVSLNYGGEHYGNFKVTEFDRDGWLIFEDNGCSPFEPETGDRIIDDSRE